MRIYIILSFFFFFNTSFAQSISQDLDLLSKLNSSEETHKERIKTITSTNELKLLLNGMFVFYKKNISSQDGSHCAFHVSCSEYALEAIHEQGVVVGGINFFDRFTRCNTCSPYQYKVHSESHRFEDEL